MGISIFGNELPSWFTLGLVFRTFWFGIENILLLCVTAISEKVWQGSKTKWWAQEKRRKQ